MVYELKNALLTIRNEGLKALPKKVFTYFCDLGKAVRFFTLRMPHGASPAAAVDFVLGPDGKLIAPTQIRSEILQLTALVQQKKPRVVVEIGTRMGGTLCLWCAAADPEATVVSIDLPGGIHGGGYPNWRKLVYRRFAQPAQSLHLLRMDSHQPKTFESLKAILPAAGIDFLFIDGDHTYPGVKMDFDMYTPLVRPGGLVAFHDICSNDQDRTNEVDKFWREIRTKYKSLEFIHHPDQAAYGIGVLEF
jgi:predicted O-methyltransferase YrrM